MTEVRVIARPNNKQTHVTVSVRCTVKRKAHPEPTGIRVPVQNWNSTLNRVMPKGQISKEQAEDYNEKIAETWDRVSAALEQLTEGSTKDDLKKILDSKNRKVAVKREYSLFDVIDITIEHSSGDSPKRLKKGGGEYAASTLEQYGYTRIALEKFFKSTGANPSDWNFLNTDFYPEFRNFLYKPKNLSSANKKPKDSSVDKHIKHLHTCISYVQKKKVLNLPARIDLEEWERTRDTDQTIVYLLPDELNILRNMQISDPKMDQVRDLFCFQEDNCLRREDLLNIRKRSFNHDYTKLLLVHGKTDTETGHLQSDYALGIIKKYAGKLGGERVIPNDIGKSTYNNLLKKLIKQLALYIEQLREAGVLGNIKSVVERSKKLLVRDLTRDMPFTFKHRGKKITEYDKIYNKISNHDARSTCITGLLLQGETPDVVKRKSGHSTSSESFYRYYEISEEIMNEFVVVKQNNRHTQLDLPLPVLENGNTAP